MELVPFERAAVSALNRPPRKVKTPCGVGMMVWRVWGGGEPLVLLHGGLRLVDALAPRHSEAFCAALLDLTALKSTRTARRRKPATGSRQARHTAPTPALRHLPLARFGAGGIGPGSL